MSVQKSDMSNLPPAAALRARSETTVASKVVIFDTELVQGRSYWLDRFKGWDSHRSGLALDHQRSPRHRAQEHEIVQRLSVDLVEEISRLTRGSDFLTYAVVLTAVKICLRGYSGRRAPAVGSPALKEMERANAVTIVDVIEPKSSFRQLLLQVRETLLETYAHQTYPLHYLIRDLGLDGVEDRCPLFGVVVLCDAIHGELPPLKNELTMSLQRVREGWALRARYDRRLLNVTTVDRFLRYVLAVLGRGLANKELAVGLLDGVTEAENHLLCCEWNDTERVGERGLSIHELFHEAATGNPEGIAIRGDGVRLSFSQLAERAERLAGRLRALGVGPEVVVGIWLERSVAMIEAILGVLKAGGAYLPLDPQYPRRRLLFMLEDSRAAVLITRLSTLRDIRGMAIPVLCVDEEDTDSADSDPEAFAGRPTHPDQLAYVLYTSGSTGRPKGVAVSHRAISNYLLFCLSTYSVAAGRGAPLHSSIGFDLTVTSLFAPLLAGRPVTLVPEDREVDFLNTAGARDADFSLVKLTPSHLTIVNQWMSPEAAPGRTRLLLLGGEPLASRELTLWRRDAPETRLINEYGPTEATVGCCVYEVSGETPTTGELPIGRPIPATRIHLLGRGLRPVPIGATGEIYIGGSGLARGYHGHASLTAEKFLPDPGPRHSGARLYRSGDLARYLPGGELVFLRRRDDQIKIRGFRVELGEVEAVLREVSGIRDAVVTTLQDDSGHLRIIAYLVRNSHGGIALPELRNDLRQRLPDYMCPSQLVLLESMPLTPHGKIDRKALPPPNPAESNTEVAPRNLIEELVSGAIAQVLGAKSVGAQDDFFEHGGDSLLATQVVSRLAATFGINLSMLLLFQAPTPSDLSLKIENLLKERDDIAGPPILPTGTKRPQPLSFAQQRLWLHQQLEPDNQALNSLSAVRLKGHLDREALLRSLEEIVRRHEILRTTFIIEDEEPVQVVHKAGPLSLPFIDLRMLNLADRQRAVQKLAEQEDSRLFDLKRGPLIRLFLVQLRRDDHVLLLNFHQIVFDGWSLGILIRESATLYEACFEKQPISLNPLTVQYSDFAAWQRRYITGEVLERQLEYWKRQLGPAVNDLALPYDRPRLRAGSSGSGGLISFSFTAETSRALAALSRQQGATPFMVSLAGLGSLLSYLTAQENICVGSPIANRNRVEIEGLIGFFVNILVLRLDLSGNPTFQQLVKRSRDVTLGAYLHQDFPFDKLVEELRPERKLDAPPLFRMWFAYQNLSLPALEVSGLLFERLEFERRSAMFDLSLFLWEREDVIEGCFEYRSDLFEESTVRRWVEAFKILMQKAVTDPELRVRDLCLAITAEERERRRKPLVEKQQAHRKLFQTISRSRSASKDREMHRESKGNISMKSLGSVRRRAVSVDPESFVRARALLEGESIPYLVEPAIEGIDLAEWAGGNREFVEGLLEKHRALYFRGFGVRSAERLDRFINATSDGELLEYRDRSSPRHEVGEKIYTSTDYPADREIFLHNEGTYWQVWPLKIYFCCVTASGRGGATPIVDCRKVLARIDPKIRQQFLDKQILYVRNFNDGFGLRWQEVFQTEDKEVVDDYCRRNFIETEWKGRDRLRTRQIRPAIALHPKTGEQMWFNHATFFNVSTLDRETRSSISAELGEEDMPYNTYYGDGSPIEDEILEELRRYYREETVIFPWEEGSVLMLDNMTIAHGREPFSGSRKVIVGMADPVQREAASK